MLSMGRAQKNVTLLTVHTHPGAFPLAASAHDAVKIVVAVVYWLLCLRTHLTPSSRGTSHVWWAGPSLIER